MQKSKLDFYKEHYGGKNKVVSSFEELEEQWKLAEQLEIELRPLLLSKAKELGVTVTMQVHDTIELGGLLENQNKLLAWMKEKTTELLNSSR